MRRETGHDSATAATVWLPAHSHWSDVAFAGVFREEGEGEGEGTGPSSEAFKRPALRRLGKRLVGFCG